METGPDEDVTSRLVIGSWMGQVLRHWGALVLDISEALRAGSGYAAGAAATRVIAANEGSPHNGVPYRATTHGEAIGDLTRVVIGLLRPIADALGVNEHTDCEAIRFSLEVTSCVADAAGIAVAANHQETPERLTANAFAAFGELAAAETRRGVDLGAMLPRMLDAIRSNGPQNTMELARNWFERSDRAGMLWLDAELVAVLESIGETGREAAETVRGLSRARWAEFTVRQPLLAYSWLSGGSDPDLFRLWRPVGNAIELIAGCAWKDKVRPTLDKQAKPPTLPLHYTSALVRSFRESRDDAPLARRQQQMGFAASSDLIKCVRSFAGMVEHRLIRWFPGEAYLRRREDLLHDSIPRPVTLPVPGGLRALAEKIGVGSKNTRLLRDALDWLQTARIFMENGNEYHGLLTWQLTAERPGHPAIVEITPCPALLFSGGYYLKKSTKLVPMPTRLPPFCGSPNAHAAQATLQLLVLVELRSFAREMVEDARRRRVSHGGVRIVRQRWNQLAEEAGVSQRVLGELLHRVWVEDGARGPAFLCGVGDDRWTLTDAYAVERSTLEEGGEMDAGAKVAGTRSSAKRQRRNRDLLS